MSGDRIRKFTEENKELAKTLKRDLDAARKPAPTKVVGTKKRGASDNNSNRGSEERQNSLPATGRGRRGRDDLDTVSSRS